MDDVRLSLLFAFLNSHGLEGVDDWLVPEHYAAWVAGAATGGLLDGGDEAARALVTRLGVLAGDTAVASADELSRARDVRDGLIATLLDADDVAVAASLDALAGDVPLRLSVSAPGRVEVEPAGTGPLAIAAAALVLAHDAAVDGTWSRVRLCHADDCHWAFADRSRNGSRRWCSMGDCGARAKARAYRERQRAGV
jgi:predicted RNA-binding Zn ribbon-like protein